jgi:hypothetical protein
VEEGASATLEGPAVADLDFSIGYAVKIFLLCNSVNHLQFSKTIFKFGKTKYVK